MENKYDIFFSFILDYFQIRSKVIVWSCGTGAVNVNNLLIIVKKSPFLKRKSREKESFLIFFEKKLFQDLTFPYMPE